MSQAVLDFDWIQDGEVDESVLSYVKPVRVSKGEGGSHRYRYSFTEIHIDDVGEIEPDGDREYVRFGDYLVSHYAGMYPIVMDEKRVYKVEDTHYKFSAERQAYFTLYGLKKVGLVSHWKQNG